MSKRIPHTRASTPPRRASSEGFDAVTSQKGPWKDTQMMDQAHAVQIGHYREDSAMPNLLPLVIGGPTMGSADTKDATPMNLMNPDVK